MIDWPRCVLLAVAGLSLLAGLALVEGWPPRLRLEIDPSTEPLLPRNDPSREAYRRAVRDFGDDEVYVIAMESPELFEAETLRTLERVTDRLARLPEVRRAESLTDVLSFRYDAEQDWIEIASFIEEVPGEAGSLAELRRRALADPLYRRNLLSEDGRTAAINLTFRELSDRELIQSRLDARIAAILAESEGPGIRFHVAGRSHLKTRVYHAMVRDMRLLVPCALAVVALGLAAVFGTRRGVLLPLGVVTLATLWTFGAMAWLERPLTVLSTLLAPVLATIGSVYGIHAVSRWEEVAREARGRRQAALRSLEELRLPVLIAGITTVVGFGALLLSDVPAVFEVGGFAMLGVACITTLTLTAFHAALALLPARAPAPTRLSRGIEARLDLLLGHVARLSASRSGGLLLLFALLALACAALLPRIEIDTDYLSYFDEDHEVRREFEAVNRLLAGAVPLYVTLSSAEPGAFREPELLRAMERLQQRSGSLPQVSRSFSVVDTLRVMNRALARDAPEEERIPDTRGEAAELLFMAPKGHLSRYANVNHSRANILLRTDAVGTAAVRQTAAALERAVDEAAFPAAVEVSVTGNAILLSHSADGIARGQPRSVGLAALAIFALLLLCFRSPGLAWLAMLPNLLPVLIFFGLLGLGVAALSLPTSLIGSVALGIAVDDTAHLLVRYAKERGQGLSAPEATDVAVRRIGRPVAITSLMLMLGFSVVALSSFATLREFGLLSAATMGICLLTDLLLLPALLNRLRP